MTPEERKTYNETYYAGNKQRITEMLLKKEECPHCGRSVAHTKFEIHKTTQLCIRRRKDSQADIKTVQNQLDRLTTELNLFETNSEVVN